MRYVFPHYFSEILKTLLLVCLSSLFGQLGFCNDIGVIEEVSAPFLGEVRRVSFPFAGTLVNVRRNAAGPHPGAKEKISLISQILIYLENRARRFKLMLLSHEDIPASSVFGRLPLFLGFFPYFQLPFPFHACVFLFTMPVV